MQSFKLQKERSGFVSRADVVKLGVIFRFFVSFLHLPKAYLIVNIIVW
jgi:hypothetical protein